MDATYALADRDRFEALVRRHQQAVCALAYAVIRNRALSEELAQEAFLIAWRNRERVAVVTAGWVCAIARNLARTASRRRTEVALEQERMTDQRNPRDELIGREDEARAEAALAQLPERYRDAVVLFYRCDESMRSVAETLGISEATARQRVHRGRAKLRAALAPVASMLGATRPGVAFTAACVAAWMVGSASTADADADVDVLGAPVATLPGHGVNWVAAAIAGAIASVTALGAIATGAGVEERAATREPGVASTAARPVASPVLPMPVDDPTVDPKARLVALNGRPFPPMDTISLYFTDVAAAGIFDVMEGVLDAPIWVDPRIDATITINGDDIPVHQAFDDIVAQANARHTEVPAVRVIYAGGRNDAAQLGGDRMTIRVTDAELHAVLRTIEPALHMPITHPALVKPGACKDVEWTDPDCLAARAAQSPRVTLDLADVPAGYVLEKALAQTTYSFELTTGYLVTPK